MITAAEKMVHLCEAMIAAGDKNEARKVARGISILTGQPAWQRAYEFMIDGECPSEYVRFTKVDLPDWLPGVLVEAHETKGEVFPNQSARGGTQLNLEAVPRATQWLDEVTGGSRIGTWTTSLPSGGFHINHIHPRGELSAVLYVDIAEDFDGGELQFGVSRANPHEKPRMSVKPELGLLVMFPCWLWHGVSPYTGDVPRVTIAFDKHANG